MWGGLLTGGRHRLARSAVTGSSPVSTGLCPQMISGARSHSHHSILSVYDNHRDILGSCTKPIQIQRHLATPNLVGWPFSTSASRSKAEPSPDTLSSVSSSSRSTQPDEVVGRSLDLPEDLDFFRVGHLFTLRDLFQARVHLGHVHRALNPSMAPFVYGNRFDTSIIDLNQTRQLLQRALNFLAHISARGGIVLFVGRQPHLTHMIEKTAIEAGEYAHCRQWSTHLFCAPHSTYEGEVRLPDVVIVVHSKDGIKYEDHGAIVHSAKVGIPTIGIVDTDCNPNIITYPIPGNDDSPSAVQLYLRLFKEAILLGKAYRKKV